MDLREKRIFVAGHRGLVGSALLRRLKVCGAEDVLTRTRAELDLTDQRAVLEFFMESRPACVFLAAAKVGGILANASYPADFIRENLLIQTNVIDGAWRSGAEKLLFLGSSCIYPRLAPQPIKEEHLLTGPLEPTNEPYAVAKIAGLKLCEALTKQYGFRTVSAMPTNLYGPGDNFDPEGSHVIPGLMRRFHEAHERGDASVTVWGTGAPRREFLHVDDLAAACLLLMERDEAQGIVNVGTGEDLPIAELAELLKDVVGYRGEIRYDTSKPDGTPRKVLDVSRLRKLGWHPTISLKAGLAQTYGWYREHHAPR